MAKYSPLVFEETPGNGHCDLFCFAQHSGTAKSFFSLGALKRQKFPPVLKSNVVSYHANSYRNDERRRPFTELNVVSRNREN